MSTSAAPDRTLSARIDLLFGGLLCVFVVALGAYALATPGAPGAHARVVGLNPATATDGPRGGGMEPQVVRGWPPPAAHALPITPADPQALFEVPRAPTPVSEVELARLLQHAHATVFGTDAPRMRLSVAWAHLALEHARGEGIECNNIGNLIVGEQSDTPYYTRLVTERLHARVPARAGEWTPVVMKFRVYDTLHEGAVAYWTLLRDRYGLALKQFDQGNAYAAGRRLSDLGYMTAEPHPYSLGMQALQAQFLSRIWPELHPGAPRVRPDKMDRWKSILDRLESKWRKESLRRQAARPAGDDSSSSR